jgi:uncharacterized membrane protein
MIGGLTWAFRKLRRQVWFRASAYGLLGVATALIAIVARPFVPDGLSGQIGADSVEDLLGILSSSMLAVTTFSVSIMMTAFAGASEGATPRSTDLLKRDGTSQQVLSTFVGAFLFSLVGIIALQTGVYGEAGRVVLFAVTVFVLAMVVVTLLGWIGHLMNFGRMADTIGRVEAAATEAMTSRLQAPFLGCNPQSEAPPVHATAVFAASAGYICYVDLPKLQRLAADRQLRIWLSAQPGAFVHDSAPIAHVDGIIDNAARRAIAAAFEIGPTRTFDQDPRFGVIALAEIASRALSPAVNDPGTAIDVIGRLVRILRQWREDDAPEVKFERLWAEAIDPADVIEDGFRPISRDGAALVEVQIRLQKGLLALAGIGPDSLRRAAAAQSAEAAARAANALSLQSERDAVSAHARRVAEIASVPRVSPCVRTVLQSGDQAT